MVTNSHFNNEFSAFLSIFGFFTNVFKNNLDIFWYAAGRRSCSALPMPMFKESKFFRPQNFAWRMATFFKHRIICSFEIGYPGVALFQWLKSSISIISLVLVSPFNMTICVKELFPLSSNPKKNKRFFLILIFFQNTWTAHHMVSQIPKWNFFTFVTT